MQLYGTSIVFVHGLIGSFAEQASFDELAPAACGGPDLQGYGGNAGVEVTLAGQVAALRRYIEGIGAHKPVHVVAHSIGAVYAFTLADQFPHMIASVTSVEGNFSLDDAFWSRAIAAMSEEQARVQVEDKLSDPDAFLRGDGILPSSSTLSRAREALDYQPWRAVWQSARAIVDATSGPDYGDLLRRVFTAKPVHLIAGERSVHAWHVPNWARKRATTFTTVRNVGHMMMLERPALVGRTLAANLRHDLRHR